VGAALLKLALKRKWVIQELDSRALSVTRFGRHELQAARPLPLISKHEFRHPLQAPTDYLICFFPSTLGDHPADVPPAWIC
jgi:hypothetical protein